ncbi:hypothetical protein KEM55_008899, partial [Ascosphaera atra]
AEYLAALVSDEESDSAANTPATQTLSPSRPPSSRATSEGRGSAARGSGSSHGRGSSRGGQGKEPVHFEEQLSAPTSASAPATPRGQRGNSASAQQQE